MCDVGLMGGVVVGGGWCEGREGGEVGEGGRGVIVRVGSGK